MYGLKSKQYYDTFINEPFGFAKFVNIDWSMSEVQLLLEIAIDNIQV